MTDIEEINIKFKNKNFRSFINERVSYGYCWNNCSADALSNHIGIEFKEMKQVHSNLIFNWKKVKQGSEGDGIIIRVGEGGAIIRTADCVPLFFYSGSTDIAGIVHAGWRGFFSGIEKKLTEKLLSMNIDLSKMRFVAGPHIEGKCYEVGKELYDKFSEISDREEIFLISEGKYFLDIFKGLKLSLIKEGVPGKNITNMKICTFCSPQKLPSFRRDKTKKRIYNFIYFR